MRIYGIINGKYWKIIFIGYRKKTKEILFIKNRNEYIINIYLDK